VCQIISKCWPHNWKSNTRVVPRDGRQIGGVDLHHGEVGQFVDADHTAVQNAPVVQGHLEVLGAVHNVIVAQDVAIRRDDDTAADAVLQLLRLRLLLHLSDLAAGAEELL